MKFKNIFLQVLDTNQLLKVATNSWFKSICQSRAETDFKISNSRNIHSLLIEFQMNFVIKLVNLENFIINGQIIVAVTNLHCSDLKFVQQMMMWELILVMHLVQLFLILLFLWHESKTDLPNTKLDVPDEGHNKFYLHRHISEEIKNISLCSVKIH